MSKPWGRRWAAGAALLLVSTAAYAPPQNSEVSCLLGLLRQAGVFSSVTEVTGHLVERLVPSTSLFGERAYSVEVTVPPLPWPPGTLVRVVVPLSASIKIEAVPQAPDHGRLSLVDAQHHRVWLSGFTLLAPDTKRTGAVQFLDQVVFESVSDEGLVRSYPGNGHEGLVVWVASDRGNATFQSLLFYVGVPVRTPAAAPL